MADEGESRPTTSSGRSARAAQLERLKAKKAAGTMVTATGRGGRRRPGSAANKRIVNLSSPDDVLKPEQPVAAEPAGAASGTGEDGVEEVDLDSSFHRKLAAQGLDDDHQPAELRFQEVSAAPSSGDPSAARSDQLKGIFDFSDNVEFAFKPAPEGGRVLCRIVRDKTGVEKGMYPTYLLRLEKPVRGGVEMIELLAARKRKKSKTSNYIISGSAAALNREDDSFAAKLRANFVGTTFTIFDNGVSPSKAAAPENAGRPMREELGAVLYETNLLGFKGPRKMTVLLPLVDEATKQRHRVVPLSDDDGLVKRSKDKGQSSFMVLGNKKPQWNEENNSYVLDFRGRVTMASVKNFQLVHESDPNYIVMQFGRVGDNEFTMDFQYPMSAVQAFAIALSSFDGKLAVE